MIAIDEEEKTSIDYDSVLMTFARMLLTLHESDDVMPESVLLKIAIHYQTPANLSKAFMNCNSDKDCEMMIFNNVDLNFEYRRIYCWIKSLKNGKMIAEPLENFDQELQELNAFLRTGFVASLDSHPTKEQKKNWSMLIFHGWMMGYMISDTKKVKKLQGINNQK